MAYSKLEYSLLPSFQKTAHVCSQCCWIVFEGSQSVRQPFPALLGFATVHIQFLTLLNIWCSFEAGTACESALCPCANLCELPVHLCGQGYTAKQHGLAFVLLRANKGRKIHEPWRDHLLPWRDVLVRKLTGRLHANDLMGVSCYGVDYGPYTLTLKMVDGAGRVVVVNLIEGTVHSL